jgi:hypothetical protein
VRFFFQHFPYWAPLCCLIFLSGCRQDAELLEEPKRVFASGSRDTVFVERSKFWQLPNQKAHVDTNRQHFIFKPKASSPMIVLLENAGGVPLRRDTFRTTDTLSLEHYLRTPGKDTNLYLRIEYADYNKAPSDVFLYIRSPDSVFREVVFVGR